ncbi:AAA family ATPase [Mycobacteroides abscessus]|uniref:AAA family ATPase n=1 Tax=Mycobacteroides abscessus TaxID=36809 RepID=UPI0009A7D5F6|nr:ATP-binding protein [Mycobacteroides abscessus]
MEDQVAAKAHTMLLGFQASNVRSFRDNIDFSLEATAMAEPGVVREIPWRESGRNYVKVLPVAGIFGANASGKSNLLRAMEDMRTIVRESFSPHSRRQSLRYLRNPFKLSAQMTDAPSTYEIDLIINGVRHEYGFTIDNDQVRSEWARRYPRGRAVTIFERNGPDLRLESRTAKARAMKELLRPDALFLSVSDAAGFEDLRPLYRWFDGNLRLCDAATRDSRAQYTAHLMEHEERRLQVLEILKLADLGITDARRRQPTKHEVELARKLFQALRVVNEGSSAAEEPEFALDAFSRIELSHRTTRGESIKLDSSEESLGTMVWLGLVGPLLDALISGTVMLVDELEASLHPLLVEQFVTLFQSPESNPNGAQLIFNSHEAKLLGNSPSDRIIGRDQAWFTEKRDDGASELYSLTDLNPRKEEAIARRYMQGRYGATPIISGNQFRALAAILTARETVEA